MSRRRMLSRDEIAIWSHVARQVLPLAGRTLPVEGTPLPPPEPGPEPAKRLALPPLPSPARPSLAPLVPLEPKMLRAVRRGRRPVEAVLDLHGLRQEDAHGRLRSFLLARQMEGATLVAVITGKGGGAPWAGADGERGVLRRQVPHWLRLPDLRPIVLGFEEAAQHHGGAGALYVRLRRPRHAGF